MERAAGLRHSGACRSASPPSAGSHPRGLRRRAAFGDLVQPEAFSPANDDISDLAAHRLEPVALQPARREPDGPPRARLRHRPLELAPDGRGLPASAAPDPGSRRPRPRARRPPPARLPAASTQPARTSRGTRRHTRSSPASPPPRSSSHRSSSASPSGGSRAGGLRGCRRSSRRRPSSSRAPSSPRSAGSRVTARERRVVPVGRLRRPPTAARGATPRCPSGSTVQA